MLNSLVRKGGILMFTQSDYDKLQQIMAESPEKKELLTRLLNSQQMTISSLSHEIRNPLTLIYSELQLVAASHPELNSSKHLNQLVQDVEYMNLLLNELSSYNNSNKLNLSIINTASFFKAAALSFAASIVDTDIEFVSKIPSDLPDISGDKVKLRQIILNLLANAKDAVLSGKATNPQIFLAVTLTDKSSEKSYLSDEKHPTDDKQLLIKISDNGCGITPKQLETIFEPFVTYKKNGTGLGLSIAHRIATAHGGSLTASSVPGNRTEFVLSLPI